MRTDADDIVKTTGATSGVDGGLLALQAKLAEARSAITAPGARYEIADEDVRGYRMPVFRHRARSLRELLDRSARFGERTFVVDGDVRLTFETHLDHVNAMASWLQREYAVQPGNRVALYAANRWEWIVAFWAVTSIGAVPAAFNGWWTAEEFHHAVQLVEPVLIIGDGPRFDRVSEHLSDVPCCDLDDLHHVFSHHADRPPDVPLFDEDSPAVLIFTSGTTGRAKAVTVPHRAIIGFVDLNLMREAFGRAVQGEPIPTAGDEPPMSDEVVLATSPLFHTSMLYGAVLTAIVKASTVVLLPGRFDPERVLRVIQQERVTMWMALGSAAMRVATSPAVGTYDTSSVRYIGVGGAPVSPSVQQSLRGAFPSAAQSLGMGYTSTEGGAVIASIAGPEFLAHPTSTGRVTPTTAVELRDPDGNPVAEGEEGEVHVRSPYVMLGYWQDPAASAAVLKPGGWLAMGDIARLQDGLLYINSRARDMILVNAENVSPTEVEYCLEEHPAVLEAAAFAVDDELTGDAVCAVVSIGSAGAATADELRAWCADRLAHFKIPTRWHLVDTPLPRTATGKLLKRQLRQSLAEAT